MMDEQFSPQEQDLIQQLHNVPKHKLDDARREAIHQQILNEFRVVGSMPQSSITYQHLPRLIPVVGAVLTTIVVVVIMALVLQQPAQTAVSPPEETLPAQIAPSASPIPQTIPPNETVAEIVLSGTPAQTATPISLAGGVVILEGPIANIVNNIITIYDFEIEVEPQHPILNLIDIGDVIRIEGELNSSEMISATVISNIVTPTNLSGDAPTVALEGPVEAINGNTLVVNGIPAQLAPDDPMLQTLQVGNFVSLQGNFESTGVTIVLIVVNITLVNNVTVIQSDCWFHDDAMGMGHWHCDGMGMGMGMGDDGMGMGMGAR